LTLSFVYVIVKALIELDNHTMNFINQEKGNIILLADLVISLVLMALMFYLIIY